MWTGDIDIVSTEKSAQNLVDRIVQDIQAGILTPGSWLKQIDLQTRYDVTRLEVRRALDQLTVMRVTAHVPNCGYHIESIDEQRLYDIREMRVIVELGAAADLIDHVTPAQIVRLRQLAEQFHALTFDGTVLDMHPVNAEFHGLLYSACQNKELPKLILELRTRMPSVLATQNRTRARIEASALEHFAIVDAVEARDLKALQRVIAAHVRQPATPAKSGSAGKARSTVKTKSSGGKK